MGCGTPKEKLENEIIAMKLERVGIQMERRNQIKLLEDIDGVKINETNIPDYLATKQKEKNINIDKSRNMITVKSIKSKNSSKPIEKRTRSKSVNVNKKFKSLKTNSTSACESKTKSKPSSKKVIK